MSSGEGSFSDGNWSIKQGCDTTTVSEHERYHRKLNDITSYGALLDAIVRLKTTHACPQHFALLSKRLVGRARMTHEVFATYFSTWGEISKVNPVPPSLLENAEYSEYFYIGAHFVGLASNRRLGSMILSAVIRLAMNGPLPAHVTLAEFDRLALSDFHTVDDPDRRLLAFRKLLTREVCGEAIAAARSHFGRDKRWNLYLEQDDDTFSIADFFSIRQRGDVAFIEPGGIPAEFETAVSNYVLDFIAEYVKEHGLQTYTLAERRAIEQRIRNAIGKRSDRFYDNPPDFEEFGHRRDIGRETIFLRPPKKTFLQHPYGVSPADWARFRAVQKEERHCPVYIRTVDDFLANHDVVSNAGSIELAEGGFICYLQKKRKLADDEIVLDVVVLQTPTQIVTTAMYLNELKDDGGLRACVSGKLLSGPLRVALDPWFEKLNEVGAPFEFLIDTHPQRILEALQPIETLVWTMSPIAQDCALQILTIYPIGGGDVPAFGLFRLGTMATIDAILKLLDPSPISALLGSSGVQIVGLSAEAEASDWSIPGHLKWTCTRYVQEDAVFRSQTPEEMLNDS